MNDAKKARVVARQKEAERRRAEGKQAKARNASLNTRAMTEGRKWKTDTNRVFEVTPR